MGRAGGGGRSGGGHSGGGSRSGGGHSSSGFGRTGGGHSASGFGRAGSGSSSRAGSGSGGGFHTGTSGGNGSVSGRGPSAPGGGMGGPGMGRGGRGGMNPPPPGGRPPRRGFWGRIWPFSRRYGGYGGYYRGGGCASVFVILIILIAAVILIPAFSVLRSGNTSTQTNQESHSTSSHNSTHHDTASSSTSDRVKIDTGLEFDSNCILDELGWVDDTASTGESLEDFYEETGIQPYVYFRDYDASLTSDSEKEEFAQEWYEDNIDNEGTFLFVYFAEEDTDNDVGYMYYVCGNDITDVMDDEACEIFWEYVDEYWYSDLSTDDMITEIFDSTADAIM